jgi:hypothetical protein
MNAIGPIIIFLLSVGAGIHFITWCFRDTPQKRSQL